MQDTFFGKTKLHSAILTACLGGMLLSACETADETAKGNLQVVEGVAGVVSADEPRAAQVGRALLGNGAPAAANQKQAIRLPPHFGAQLLHDRRYMRLASATPALDVTQF